MLLMENEKLKVKATILASSLLFKVLRVIISMFPLLKSIQHCILKANDMQKLDSATLTTFGCILNLLVVVFSH